MGFQVRVHKLWLLFIMPKRRTFGHFLAFSEDNFFLVKKENMSFERRTYGKSGNVQYQPPQVWSGLGWVKIWFG